MGLLALGIAADCATRDDGKLTAVASYQLWGVCPFLKAMESTISGVANTVPLGPMLLPTPFLVPAKHFWKVGGPQDSKGAHGVKIIGDLCAV